MVGGKESILGAVAHLSLYGYVPVWVCFLQPKHIWWEFTFCI